MDVGTGAAWIDYDNDGWLDLYITNRIGANKMFHNNGDGTFTDLAGVLGIADETNDGAGVIAGDINNDGWIDLYLANSDNNVLFRNDGGTGFTDITASSTLSSIGESRSTSASFGDYDNDGYLDLYVSHHMGIMSTGVGSTQDYFFHNNGNETFTDVSALLDVSLLLDPGFIGGWTDYDSDGDQDIIVINDCPLGTGLNSGTLVYRNDGGTDPLTDWQFTEVSTAIVEDNCSHGMGLAIGDIDRDGDFDMLYSNVGSVVYFVNNNGVFNEDNDAGFDIQPGDHFSWGTSFLDWDNDGWQDASMAIGALEFGTSIDGSQECNFFKNNGDGTFTDQAASMGLDDTLHTRTIVHGDYDNDGDLDLLMINYGESVRLMRNDIINSNNYVRIKLDSEESAPQGIGSVVEVTTNDGVTQYFEMRSGSNLSGGDEIRAHFGLGTATAIESIKVRWLSGNQTMVFDQPINTEITIKEKVDSKTYVRQSATGNADGSSWSDAYPRLEYALASARAGDSILVADAIYKPTPTDDESETFTVENDYHIFGGFPAIGGQFGDRIPTAYNTVLSGFVGEDQANTNRSLHILTVSTDVADASIDGVKITGGSADGATADQQSGAGILCEGYLSINNVSLENNSALMAGSDILVDGSVAELVVENGEANQSDVLVPAVSAVGGGKITTKGSFMIKKP